jgi:uncharacterized protein (TIGR02099 family)
MSRRFFTLIIQRFWMSLAAVVLLLSIAALGIRWALPGQISGHRAEIETYVSSFIGRPIAVKDVSADWRGWSPQLHLIGVDIPDPAYPSPPIRFERISLRLDLLASYQANDFRPSRVNFAGLQATARHKLDDSIYIEGTDPENDDFLRWILKQRQVHFADGQVIWIDEKTGHPPVTLTEVTLQLRNNGEHHQLLATAQPPNDMGENLRLGLDARGDLLTTDWNGEVYAEGKTMTPALLFDAARLDQKLHGGQGDFRIWSTWRQSRLNDIQGDFSASALKLEFSDLFKEPLALDQISGDFRWRQTTEGWQFHATEIAVSNPDIEARLSGGVAVSEGHAPFLDLLIQFQNGHMESFKKYVPLTLPPKAYEWLARAFHGGLVPRGGAVLRGPLDEIPFDRQQGRFAVWAEGAGVVLDYGPHWPVIHGLDGVVDIEGRVLNVRADKGRIFDGIDLQAITTHIPDLGNGKPHVRIHGHAQGPAEQGRRFVMESPLKETVGKQIEPLDIGGGIQVELNLDIFPVEIEKTLVTGKVSFPGNPLKVRELDLAFNDFAGLFHFGRDDWSGEGLRAKLFGQPVRMDLKGGEGHGSLQIQGRADRRFIGERLRAAGPALARWVENTNNLEGLIEGETDWQARIDLSRPWDDPKSGGNLHVSSNLVGLRLAMPSPLGKTATESRQFSLKTSLAPSKSRPLDIHYGDLVNVEHRHTGKSSDTLAGQTVVRLGKRKISPSRAADLWVGGSLEEFPLDAWLDFMRNHHLTLPSQGTPSSAQPTHFDVEISRLKAFAHDWKNLHVVARNQANPSHWSIHLDGPETAGRIQVYPDKSPPVIDAELERLKLAQQVGASGHTSLRDIDPGKIPALSFRCKHFTFESVDLGETTLKTHPIAGRLQIDKASFASPDFQIDASGLWGVIQQAHSSRFDIRVKAADLGNLLERFGYNATAIQGGKTRMEIQAEWPGTPADYSLAGLQGRLKLEVTDGRLTEMENRIGRIFGLLSVQTLPRRLFLDFSDLFKKGFTFDSIEGTFTLENGNAYTNDLSVAGPSARIDVTGRTGLVTQDYDQVVTVTPALASTLPVASALFGPVGAGVGAGILLAEQVFSSLPEHIDKMLSRKYTVTGPWDTPVIK